MTTRSRKIRPIKAKVAGVADVAGMVQASESKPILPEEPSPETIAALAHELWVRRGCPQGSPEEDWYRAEEELKNRCTRAATASTNA